AFVVAAAAEIFVSSTPIDWEASWSVGARRLLPLTPILAVAGARGTDRILARLRVRPSRWVATAVVLLTLVANIPTATTLRGDRAYRQEELYLRGLGLGVLFRPLDRYVGDLAVLPAELAFAARYRLPVGRYREVLFERYQRDYRTLIFANDVLSMEDPDVRRITRGFAEGNDGAARLRSDEAHPSRATVVFRAGWPFATHVTVTASAPDARAPVALRVGRGAALGDVMYEPREGLRVGADVRAYTFEVPPGAFDSGIFELVLETSSSSSTEVLIHAVRIEDRTPRTPFPIAPLQPLRR
ncbi:MAG: hypothetical protein KF819_28870, partial [Labilithrix sp.]|nr:hypothetical protein [Labilithrix sp.]